MFIQNECVFLFLSKYCVFFFNEKTCFTTKFSFNFSFLYIKNITSPTHVPERVKHNQYFYIAFDIIFFVVEKKKICCTTQCKLWVFYATTELTASVDSKDLITLQRQKTRIA